MVDVPVNRMAIVRIPEQPARCVMCVDGQWRPARTTTRLRSVVCIRVKKAVSSFCRETTDAVKKPVRVSFTPTLITSDRISAARLDGRAVFFLWRRFRGCACRTRLAAYLPPPARLRCARQAWRATMRSPSISNGPFLAANSSTIVCTKVNHSPRGLSIVAAARITAASSSI